MGRAYEVRKASIQKTGQARGKVYTTFAKEIYLAAKKGVPEIDANVALKRIVEKAKKNQVPNDIITRAIEKAKGIGGEDYHEVIYEGFGPGASTLIIKCLTDNVNRTVGLVRAAFNKVNKSLGVTNSVSYNYDYVGVISFKTTNSMELFEQLLNEGIDLIDFEVLEDEVYITTKPTDHDKVKDILEKNVPNIDYEIDKLGMFPKDKTTLDGEDLEVFKKLYTMLDDIDDVTEIYHNVDIDL